MIARFPTHDFRFDPGSSLSMRIAREIDRFISASWVAAGSDFAHDWFRRGIDDRVSHRAPFLFAGIFTGEVSLAVPAPWGNNAAQVEFLVDIAEALREGWGSPATELL